MTKGAESILNIASKQQNKYAKIALCLAGFGTMLSGLSISVIGSADAVANAACNRSLFFDKHILEDNSLYKNCKDSSIFKKLEVKDAE